MAAGDQSNGFGPGQRRAFPFRVIRTFTPGIQRVQPLLAFSDRAQVFPVHIQTIGAAVDLRCSQLDQVEQRLFQATLVKILLEPYHHFVYAGGRLHEIDTWFQIKSPIEFCDSEVWMMKAKDALQPRAVSSVSGLRSAEEKHPDPRSQSTILSIAVCAIG